MDWINITTDECYESSVRRYYWLKANYVHDADSVPPLEEME